MDKQQQISKKKPKKSKPQTMKNVLLTPYKRSWPLLPQQYEREFQNIFYSNLSLLVPQKQPKIAWSVLKDIPKEQRRDFRQKYKKPIEIDSSLRKSLIFGVNECTKALEKHEILAIFISSTCNPEMMVNHIVRMAEKRKIAVSVILSLKESLKTLIGFPCLCLGIRKYKNLEDLGKLKEIVEFVYKIKDMNIADVVENSETLNDNIERENNIFVEDSIIVIDDLLNPGPDSPKITAGTNLDESVQIITEDSVNSALIKEFHKNTGQDLLRIDTSDVIMIPDSPGAGPNSPKITNLDDSVQIITEVNSALSKEILKNAGQDLNRLDTSDIIMIPDSPGADPDSALSDSVQIIEETLLNKSAGPEGRISEEKVVSSSEIDLGPYLYRTSTNQRAFVPPRSDGFQKNVKVLTSTEEFISLGGNFKQYVPSVVKRLKGSGRVKNKNKKKNKGSKNQELKAKN